MKAKINFNAVFEPSSEGGYIAYIPEFPGVNTQGETLAEAKRNLKEAFAIMVEVSREISMRNFPNSNKALREKIEFAA